MTPHPMAIAAAIAFVAGSPALAADPSAALNRTFAEYTGTGPIGNDNINNDTTFFWFKEKTGVHASQAVQSWFLFWDPRQTRSVSGSITFDQPIVAVIWDRPGLIASASFGKAGVTYDYSDAAVGLELNNPDTFAVAGNLLTISWNASNPGDHIRVLTAVPEPGTYALMAAGLGAIGLVARRRRTR